MQINPIQSAYIVNQDRAGNIAIMRISDKRQVDLANGDAMGFRNGLARVGAIVDDAKYMEAFDQLCGMYF